MDTLRRKVVSVLAMAAALMTPAEAGWFGLGGNPKVRTIELKIQDKSGKPIPYASIWRYVRSERNPSPDALEMSDLWRLANRFRNESYEFVNNSVKLIRQMGVNPMTNQQGVSREEFPSGINEPVEVGFVILKRGYLPAKVITSTSIQAGDLSLTITLQPDTESTPAPGYLEKFDRIRYENTSIDIRDGSQVSSISLLIEQLNALADEALFAGDKESAAKMLFYISYLPGTTPGGAERVAFYSAPAITARKKVAQLKPHNAFIQLSLLGAEGNQFQGISVALGNASSERLNAYKDYVMRYASLLDKLGDRAWPSDHASLIYNYRDLGMKDQMNAQIVKVRAMEPKLGIPPLQK